MVDPVTIRLRAAPIAAAEIVIVTYVNQVQLKVFVITPIALALPVPRTRIAVTPKLALEEPTQTLAVRLSALISLIVKTRLLSETCSRKLSAWAQARRWEE